MKCLHISWKSSIFAPDFKKKSISNVLELRYKKDLFNFIKGKGTTMKVLKTVLNLWVKGFVEAARLQNMGLSR